MIIRTVSGLAALAAVALTTLGFAPAQAAYPERPITLIVPWGAGGGTDATGRILASLMERELGVPVSVVNRTGGSGVVGHSAIATATPDGYTLGVITVEIGMMHWQGLTDLTYDDYTPLVLYNADAAGLQVRADAEWQNAQQLLDAIKANPGRGCRARAPRPVCRIWSRAASTSCPARCPRRRRCSRPAGSRASR
jgi:tripartite-type tricarboxylate transporter receptor subunit TctC